MTMYVTFLMYLIYTPFELIYVLCVLQKELCNMIVDCCAQQRTYEKFFGLLAGVKLLYLKSLSVCLSLLSCLCSQTGDT